MLKLTRMLAVGHRTIEFSVRDPTVFQAYRDTGHYYTLWFIKTFSGGLY